MIKRLKDLTAGDIVGFGVYKTPDFQDALDEFEKCLKALAEAYEKAELAIRLAKISTECALEATEFWLQCEKIKSRIVQKGGLDV